VIISLVTSAAFVFARSESNHQEYRKGNYLAIIYVDCLLIDLYLLSALGFESLRNLSAHWPPQFQIPKNPPDETSTYFTDDLHTVAMDLAYDHIAEQSLPKEDGGSGSNGQTSKPESTLNEDLQQAYRAFSSSSWGSWLGGTVEKVVKQV
jgi:hypothetical protein